jgi:hypothetical protein
MNKDIVIESATVTIAFILSKKKRKKNRSVWVRDWLRERKRLGAYNNLMKELSLSDQCTFKNFARLDVETFNKLLRMTESAITHQTTLFREPIGPGERLAVTLRYLATGE